VDVDGFTVLEGTASARIVVLDAWDDVDEDADEDDAPLPDVALRPAERTPPAPRRPVLEDADDPDEDEDQDADADVDEPEDAAAGVVDRAYEGRSAR
jgi:hypothetical protein